MCKSHYYKKRSACLVASASIICLIQSELFSSKDYNAVPVVFVVNLVFATFSNY